MALSKKARKRYHELIDEMLDIFDETEAEEEEEEEDEVAAARKKKKGKKGKKGKKEEPEEEEADEPSLNQVRKAMRAYSSEYGKSEARKLLKPYGVTTLASLDEDDYANLLTDIENAEEED